jgi:hypothetical protein
MQSAMTQAVALIRSESVDRLKQTGDWSQLAHVQKSPPVQAERPDSPGARQARASQKSEQPVKRISKMRRKAPNLASHVSNLMEIHQGKDHGIEHGKDLRDGKNANPQ